MYTNNKIIQEDNGGGGHISSPEKELIFAIIQRAIADASTKYNTMLSWEAIDFLFTDRINPYAELLDMDPIIFREGLIRTMRTARTKITRDSAPARNFCINYEKYFKRAFKCTIPRDILYGERI